MEQHLTAKSVWWWWKYQFSSFPTISRLIFEIISWSLYKLVPFGTLGSLLSKSKVEFDLKLRIALDVSKGLNFLHFNGIIHRDIKVSYFLFSFLWKSFSTHQIPNSNQKKKPDNVLVSFFLFIFFHFWFQPLNPKHWNTKITWFIKSLQVLIWRRVLLPRSQISIPVGFWEVKQIGQRQRELGLQFSWHQKSWMAQNMGNVFDIFLFISSSGQL